MTSDYLLLILDESVFVSQKKGSHPPLFEAKDSHTYFVYTTSKMPSCTILQLIVPSPRGSRILAAPLVGRLANICHPVKNLLLIKTVWQMQQFKMITCSHKWHFYCLYINNK